MADENEQVDETERDEQATATPPAKPRKPESPPRRDEPADDDADLKSEVERLRQQTRQKDADAKRLRQKLEDFERKAREEEDAKLGETERLQKARDEAARKAAEAESAAARARAELIEERINLAVEREAAKQGFSYPDKVSRLIDRDRIEIDQDDPKKIVGVKEAVERLAKECPGMLTARPGGGTPSREAPNRRAAPGERQPSYEDVVREQQRKHVKYSF